LINQLRNLSGKEVENAASEPFLPVLRYGFLYLPVLLPGAEILLLPVPATGIPGKAPAGPAALPPNPKR